MLWRTLIRPLLFRLDPEGVHERTMHWFSWLLGFRLLRALVAKRFQVRAPALRSERFGIVFDGPVGLAAGFDKNAAWYDALDALGFGFIEVGTLTGHPQPGNPTPRLFRLPADRALINRLGFNNHGSEAAARALHGATIRPVLGINIGKSKIVANEDALEDYLLSFERLVPYARYITINVSSPNTPGLRELQHRDALEHLLAGIQTRNHEWAAAAGRAPVPVLVKLAPDLEHDALAEAVELVEQLGIDGIIATNTTNARDGLSTPADAVEQIGAGGLSGQPLTQRSRAFVAEIYRLSGGRVPIIGVGGIMDGDDAWEMLRAGASLVQLYTGFVYGGPGVVAAMHRRIAARLAERGLTSIDDIVGDAHREAPAADLG